MELVEHDSRPRRHHRGRHQGTLLYVTGGLALAGVKSNWGAGYTGGAGRTAASNLNPNSFSSDGVKVSWTAGLGIEHMFASAPHWSLRAEVLWVQLANDNGHQSRPEHLQRTYWT